MFIKLFKVVAVLSGILGALELPLMEGVKYRLWGLLALYIPRQGRLLCLQLSSPSMGRGARRLCWLYLPPGYDTRSTRLYPVVVLLHGAPGAPEDWLMKGGAGSTTEKLILDGRLQPLLLAIPDGRGCGPRNSSLYANAANRIPDGAVEDWIARDLPRVLLTCYHADPDPRAWSVGGLSEGGFGALNMVCRHPDRFRAAFSLSGFYHLDTDDRWAIQLLGTAPQRLAAYSPDRTVERLRPATDFFFMLAAGSQEYDCLRETRRFAGHLDVLRIPHVVLVMPGGHGWSFWSRSLSVALADISPRLGLRDRGKAARQEGAR